ncbi:LPP20 family lipoprotein [Marinomonas sp. IMCC 4694]|uniref:LPP20 family lipoprotein n=1 Tax=Marinomonas sp. IMCC 4694 TaxID=2605432 RepID=UPI0011E77FE1|nr:LPP20 family lipoprotein [Marinomonas sp. IMCC 4694]TYL46794.1 hypothetical protein FXV75_01915 [Marinomonas sp. IMCC 4694]
MIYSALPTPYRWVITTSLVISLTGCLGTQTTQHQEEAVPSWVLSPPKSDAHLYGVGSAPRIDNVALAFIQAEQNGNVQIAQQLRTQISQVNTQDIQVRSGQGAEQISQTSTAYTRIATSAIELEQATNEQRFAGERYVYALQSIDRRRIVAKLTRAINDTDDQIRRQAALLSQSDDQPPVAQDWRIYMSLIPYFAQRKSDQKELSLYSTEHNTAGKADVNIRSIEQQLSNALAFYGFDASQTKQADTLASALSRFGLTPKNDSTFTLSTRTTQQSETQNGRVYVFEEGSLALSGPTGARLASWTVSARGIGKSQESAEKEASINWSNQAIEAMFTWLTQLP